MACEKIPPLQLPWKDVFFVQNQTPAARGIPLSLGTPPQQLSFLPLVELNNTLVADSSHCDEFEPVGTPCFGEVLGGVFNITQSSSSVFVNPPQWNGSDLPAFPSDPSIYLQDTLRTGPQHAIFGFPVAATTGFLQLHAALGLGPNSSFIQAVRANRLCASSVWSLWTGSRSTARPADGLLMLGGFDQARLTQPPINFSITSPSTSSPPTLEGIPGRCLLSVRIASIVYESDNNSTPLYRNSDAPLTACLAPFSNYIQLPPDPWNLFAQASGGVYDPDINVQDLVYNGTEPPRGSLTFTLDNGYVTTIPPEELFVNPRNWTQNGQYTVYDNSSHVSELASATTYPENSLNLGVAFLTMNYLIVDYERNQFQMAPANRSIFPQADVAQQPVVICPSTSPSEPGTSGTSTVQSSAVVMSSTSSTLAAVSPAALTAAKTNSGTIVGAITGFGLGVAALSLLGLFVLCRHHRRSRRRRRSRWRVKEEEQHVEMVHLIPRKPLPGGSGHRNQIHRMGLLASPM